MNAPKKLTQVNKFELLTADFGEYGISSHELYATEPSAKISGGVAMFRDVAHEWTVWYDEILFCHSVENFFEIIIDGTSQRMVPGDSVYLPAQTSLIYKSTGTSVLFYTATPVNWADDLEENMR